MGGPGPGLGRAKKLATIRCPCGSGKTFGDCCQAKDLDLDALKTHTLTALAACNAAPEFVYAYERTGLVIFEQFRKTKPMRLSDLLFPSVTGGFRARSVLDKPFDDVAKKIGLKFNFTPRGMRRTYQDLARPAGIHDAVTRAISGHATPAMQLHYSTARGGEVKDALSKVAQIAMAGADIIDFAEARRRRAGE